MSVHNLVQCLHHRWLTIFISFEAPMSHEEAFLTFLDADSLLSISTNVRKHTQ